MVRGDIPPQYTANSLNFGPLSSQSPATLLELLACASEQYNTLVGTSSSVPVPAPEPTPTPLAPVVSPASTVVHVAPSVPFHAQTPRTPPHSHSVTLPSSPFLSPVPASVATGGSTQAAATSVGKDFEVLIKIQVKTKGRSAKKKAKVDDANHKFGPGLGNTQQSWTDFRKLVAKEVGVKEGLLAVSSMTWRWMKPANSELLPLASENGYLSLLKQVTASKAMIPYIFVFMDPPADNKDEPLSLTDDDSAEESPTRKASTAPGCLDPKLQDIAEDLKDTYFGTCMDHPEQSCFHQRALNRHFILDRIKSLVWAKEIMLGKATKTKPPLGSNHFQKEKAVTVEKKPADKNSGPRPDEGVQTSASMGSATCSTLSPWNMASAEVQIPPHSHTVPSSMELLHTMRSPYSGLSFPPSYPGYPPMPAIPYPYAAGFHGYLPPHFPSTPPHVSSNATIFPPVDPRLHQTRHGPSNPCYTPVAANRSSPPPPASTSIEEMCELYELGPEFVARLQQLKFRIGDNLSILGEEDWRKVGFDKLEWNRVLTAYRRYKRTFADF